MRNWTMVLCIKGPYGEFYDMALDVDEATMSELIDIQRPDPFDIALAADPMKEVATVLKRRVFRKDLFIDTAARSGALLAERLEDKEGWHGESRAQKLIEWGTR